MLRGHDTGALGEAEIKRLNEFLERGSEATLDVESVDGLFAALVCSPILLKPSEWMPLVWGGAAPEWESIEEFGEFTGLIMRLWNDVARTINDGTYVPILTVLRDNTGKEMYMPFSWCRGFYVGMVQHADLWLDNRDLELAELLQPIRSLLLELVDELENMKKGVEPDLDRLSTEAINELVEQIPDSVVAVREYWLDNPPKRRPTTRATPKVGRNDPCPCGSGRKFKLCHGAGETTH